MTFLCWQTCFFDILKVVPTDRKSLIANYANGSGVVTSINSAPQHTLLGHRSDRVGAVTDSPPTAFAIDVNPDQIVTHCVHYNRRFSGPKCVGGVQCVDLQ